MNFDHFNEFQKSLDFDHFNKFSKIFEFWRFWLTVYRVELCVVFHLQWRLFPLLKLKEIFVNEFVFYVWRPHRWNCNCRIHCFSPFLSWLLMSKVVFVYFSTIYQLCRRCCKCKNEILTLSKHEKLTRGCVIYVILVPLKVIPDLKWLG